MHFWQGAGTGKPVTAASAVCTWLSSRAKSSCDIRSQMERTMVPNDTMHPVLPKTQAKGRALAILVATACLLGAGAGYVHAAVPAQRSAVSSSPNNDGARPEDHGVRLAATAVPKVSVPQVHVNVGTHVQSPKISTPQIHANVGTHVNTSNGHSANGIRGAHRLDKNDTFLQLDGIKGESQDDSHTDQIDVQSFK
jgi:Type VI secretion system effector, Hcp